MPDILITKGNDVPQQEKKFMIPGLIGGGLSLASGLLQNSANRKEAEKARKYQDATLTTAWERNKEAASLASGS